MEEYEVKKIVNLPNEEIDRIQESINAHNLETIAEAYNQRRINTDDRDYLLNFYHDGMGVYREVYRALFEMFKHPEYTCAYDPQSGKVDTDSSGNPINYGLKAVTPFTSTRLEYVDKFKNPIYVIFPKMKSAERAIEKLESEYGKEYAQELLEASRSLFELEDREKFCEKIQNIKKGSAKLHDILRLTITCKYFTDVERIKRVMAENRSGLKRHFFINQNETRDRFLKPLEKNPKKYYDIKMIMHQLTPEGKTLDVEVQLKINTLYNADLRTHKTYEEIRKIEADLALNPRAGDSPETRQKKATIKILTNRIRQTNENAIHQYNMMVVDKARRIEDDGYRPLRINPDYSDGTYHQCRQIINNEYMVESFAPFVPQTAFNPDNEVNKLCYLRMLGKLENDFDEFSPNSSLKIDLEFANLSAAELTRFKRIEETATAYAPVINRKINSRRQQEAAGKISFSLPRTQNDR